MRLLSLVPLLLLVAAVAARSKVQRTAALTDQLGQEVIEIPGPIRDLPQGVDEEPAPENDLVMGAQTIAPKTTTEGQLVYAMNRTRRYRQGADDEEARLRKELDEVYKDDDYKNDPTTTTDSTTEPPTSTSEAPPTTPGASKSTTECANCTNYDAIMDEIYQPDEEEKAILKANIGRQNNEDLFQFQPRNAQDPAEVARFRTAKDDVACDKRQRASDLPGGEGEGWEFQTTELPTMKKNASAVFVNIFVMLSALLSLILR
ncbi:hypothetical protein JYU34_008253 [Plutella xylostella]|uniref:Uncharacterized protein n=1 Tax=Plutella xylostella TaxID=51655 RepID=A0ABQ7QP29_PLUXY|nr:hypothetical protein JYU34_008253 [Plutella xylostella]